MTLHHGGDLSWPTFEVVRVELGEDRAVHDRCHGQVTPGHPHEHVAHEVDRKAWPTSPGIDFGDGRLQPEVGIADDELDATESSATKRPQELGPRGDVLGLTNGDAQNPHLKSSPTPVEATTARQATRSPTQALTQMTSQSR